MLQSASREVGTANAPSDDPRRVRLYLLAPVIFFLIPAIIEFGSLVSATAALNDVAVEGAQVAALGATPARIERAVVDSSSRIDADQVYTATWRRAPNGRQDESSVWHILADTGVENDAAAGEQIRVELTYSHRLLLGGLSGPFLGAAEDNTVRLTARAEVVRK